MRSCTVMSENCRCIPWLLSCMVDRCRVDTDVASTQMSRRHRCHVVPTSSLSLLLAVSFLDETFECAAGFEGGRGALGDEQGLAGGGVAAFSGRADASLKAAESGDADLVALGDGGLDGVEDGVDGDLGIGLGQRAVCRDDVDEVLLAQVGLCREVAVCVGGWLEYVEPRDVLEAEQRRHGDGLRGRCCACV